MGAGDSKAVIHSTVAELCSGPVTSEETLQRFLIPTTAEEVFAALQMDDVRTMRRQQPRNMALFLRKMIDVLRSVAANPDSSYYPALLTCVRILTRLMPVLLEAEAEEFLRKVLWENRVPPPEPTPPPPAAPAAPAAPSAAPAPPQQAFAARGAVAAPEEDGAAAEGEAATASTPAPAATEAEAEEEEVKGDTAAAAAEDEGEEETKGDVVVIHTALAELLVDAVYALCFLPGFTVPRDQYEVWAQAQSQADEHLSAAMGNDNDEAEAEGEGEEAEEGTAPAASAPAKRRHDSYSLPTTAIVETLLLWAPGVGFPDVPVQSGSAINANRVEVLRLLLTLMSGPLYHVPDASTPMVDRMCSAAVSPARSLVPTLFYSLLNTVLQYDPVGWGLPYGSSLSSDTEEPLMNVSLHVLLVMLDYAPYRLMNSRGAGTPLSSPLAGAAPGTPGGSPGTPGAGEAMIQVPNMFRGLLAGLQQQGDFELLYKGISRLLNHVHRADNTYLPYSMKQLNNHQEVLVLLWKAMDTNPGFLTYILYHPTAVTDLIVPIVYCMFQARNRAPKVGLIHICTFTLLLLSGARSFGVALNEPFTEKLPAALPLFKGNHADLLFIVLHKLIVSGNVGLRPLFSCFLTVICNVTPYVKRLSMVTSVKLVNLFELFANPKFISRAQQNAGFVSQLLTAFNNVIQYQYEGNTHLVYAIIRRKQAFYQLATLTSQAQHRQQRSASQAALPPPLPAAGAAQAGAAQAGAAQAEAEAEAEAGEGAGAAEAEVGPEDEAEAEAGEGSSAAAPATETEAEAEAEAAPSAAPAPASEAGEAAGDEAGEAAEDGAAARHPPAIPQGLPVPPLAQVNVQMLKVVLRLINYVAPRMEAYCASSERVVDDSSVVEYLERVTAVGVLPVPHTILMSRFQANEFTHLWFTTFTWGTIFLKHRDLALMDARSIKLFTLAYTDKKAGETAV